MTAFVDDNKIFVCVCGKEFTNSQSFNGHKSHCKVHQLQKYGNLDKLQFVKDKQAKSKSKTWKIKNAQLTRECNNLEYSKLQQWISEQHTCEKCGKIMTEKFGSGRFCSRACANSRMHSEETKKKISKSLSISDNANSINTISKVCLICGKALSKRNTSGYCLECIRHSPLLQEYRSNIGKRASSCVKTHVTWLSRDKLSYPEKFWINVLDNNSINYTHNFPVIIDKQHRYFLDFYINKNGIKVDLEIDGKQHAYSDRLAHDIKRDYILQDMQYIVFRIKWNEINSQSGKDLMKKKIDNFLEFYNSI